MGEFFLSVLVFLLAHIIPPYPPVRAKLVALLGRRLYLLTYSALSIGLLTWMILAGQRAPYVQIWQAGEWQSWVTIIIMPFALWLVLAGLFEPNPLSISVRKKDINIPLGLSARVTRHPVLWGFLLWALTHLLPNGDVVSLVLFGGVILLAIMGFFVVDRRTKTRLGEAQWHAVAEPTHPVPFVALFSGKTKLVFTMQTWVWMGVTFLTYFWILFSAHADYLGVDPLAGVGY